MKISARHQGGKYELLVDNEIVPANAVVKIEAAGLAQILMAVSTQSISSALETALPGVVRQLASRTISVKTVERDSTGRITAIVEKSL